MEVKKDSYKTFSIIFIFIICIMLNLFFYKTFAINLSSNYYKIDSNNKIISRLGPKTSVEIFKKATNIQSGELKVYKDTNLKDEITTGYIGTGMVATDENKNDIYQISVVGDLDGDGKASQVELTHIIRNLTGLKGYDLKGIKKISADINGDENVNQIDITKYINYLVFGELDIKRPEPDFDLVAPEVNVIVQSKTTSTITVKASATDDKDMPEPFVYVYYIKEASQPDSAYQHKKSGTEDTFTFTRLKMNTNYTIKVETTDVAGNKGFKEINAKTSGDSNILEGTVQITSPVWENGKANVTVTTDTDYDIEYQINNGDWIKLPKGQNTITNLNNGDIINARITDGTNAGNYTSITIQDALPPTVDLELGTSTTCKIEATASNPRDEQTGIQTPVTYKFYIKKTNEDDSNYQLKETSISSTYTFTELVQNTDYTVKVEVTDKAGNVGKAEKTNKTKTLPALNDIIEVEDPVWNDGEASIGVKVDRDKLDEDSKVLVQINGGDWTELPKGQEIIPGLKDGDEVHIKVTDGTNESEEIVVIVKDEIPPIVSLEVGTITMSSIQVSAEAKDEQSGISDTATYKFYIKEKNQDDTEYQEKQNTTSRTCNFEGLTRDKTYTIKVEVLDIAGNLGSATKEATALGIPGGSEEGAIIFENLVWNNGKASIVVKTNTNFQIEYKINGTSGQWSKGEEGQKNITVQNLKHNDDLYARLTDGINTGSWAKAEIRDTIKPTVILSLQPTASTIIATASATDNQSGISNSATYKFSIKETSKDDSTYEVKQNTTDRTYTFTGLTQNVSYTVKIEVSDIAGNLNSKTEVTTTNVIPSGDETGAIQFGFPTWNNGKASIVVSTTTTYQIQYQLGGHEDGKWTKVPVSQNSYTIPNLNHGTVIYARLADGESTGHYTSTTITDNDNPSATINVATSVNMNQSLKATVIHQDNQSGINIGQCKWIFNNTSEDIGINAENYTGTFSNITQEISLNTSVDGTFYLHVLSVDNAGNAVETKSGAIKIIDERKIYTLGQYVKYNISYTDMYTDYNFTANDGWRVLDPEATDDEGNSVVKLISTGIPAKFNYGDSKVTWLSWANNATNANKYASKFYTSGSSNNNNMLLVGGLYYNLAKVSFAKSHASGSNISNINCTIKNINGQTYSTPGNIFLMGGATNVHALTLTEINEARNKKVGSKQYGLKPEETNFSMNVTSVNDPATGLFNLIDLGKFNYSNDTYGNNINKGYYLASPSKGSQDNLYLLNTNGVFATAGVSFNYGMRIVVCVPSDTILEKVSN